MKCYTVNKEQKDQVTAVQLAEKFEVSKRTINRDIEELCKAGVPVCTRQGQGGGISIMDNYKFNRTLMTSKEMRAILAGLRSLDSVSGNNQSVLIDLSFWYRDTLAPKITMLQTAIEKRLCVTFQYYSPKGDSRRMIEPYYLIFKWTSWYIWGCCRERCDFWMFKLNRLENIGGSGKYVKDIVCPDGCVMFRLTAGKIGNENFYK